MRTLENLVNAFIGESVARNRYTFYAKVAKEEGYVFVAKVFLETAENEKEHAETLLELIQKIKGDTTNIKAEVETPIVLGDTIQNLKTAIEGETYEWEKMYPEFAKIAEEEDMNEVAGMLRAIAKAEEHHKKRFEKLLEAIESGTMFKRDESVAWICLECGYIHHGEEPPERCPSCGHARAYFVAQDLLCLKI